MSEDTITILVITHFFPPESMGGAHRWERLSQNFSERVECKVVCPPPTYPFGEFERTYQPVKFDSVNGLDVTRLWTYQPKSLDSVVGRIANYVVFAIFATLYVILNFWRFDCIITMSTPHTTFLPGITGKILGRTWIPDIFDLWIDNAVDFGYIEEGSFSYRIGRMLEWTAMRWSDHIFVITKTMSEYYSNRYDVPLSKFVEIPFGVDDDLFSSEEKHEAKKRVIYTGNLGTLQPFEPYIRGFAKWASDEAELYLVGSGEREEELKNLVKELEIDDRVTFTGQLPRSKIPELVSSAAVSWVPLDTENHLDYARPTKLLESMAVGTPYIASEVQEIERVTEKSNAGITVQNNSEEVANALNELFSDKKKRHEMGEQGIAYIDANHRWRALATTAQNTIQKLVNK